jgi:lysophospholipase L1-like esterase
MPKARIISPDELDADTPPDLNQFNPTLIAEGDSWFTLGSIPAHNLLQHLDFASHGAVVSLAHPGDTVQSMRRQIERGSTRRMHAWGSQFAKYVADPATYPFTAILLSGGGNDLIDAVPHLLKKGFDFGAVDPAQPDGAMDPMQLAAFDRYVADSFTGIVNFVREHGGPNRDAPIFCHTYDYPTPNDAPATIFGVRVGSAWLLPALKGAGVPSELWQSIADHLVRHLAALLKGLDLPDFHVVDTLGTIERAKPDATGESGDWDNEIHPNAAGYRKLAAKIVKAISDEVGLQ